MCSSVLHSWRLCTVSFLVFGHAKCTLFHSKYSANTHSSNMFKDWLNFEYSAKATVSFYELHECTPFHSNCSANLHRFTLCILRRYWKNQYVAPNETTGNAKRCTLTEHCTLSEVLLFVNVIVLLLALHLSFDVHFAMSITLCHWHFLTNIVFCYCQCSLLVAQHCCM